MSDYDHVEERKVDDDVTFRYFVIDRTGTRYSHSECERRLRSAVSTMTRWFHRSIVTRSSWRDPAMNADELERLRWVLDDLQTYVEVVQRELDRIAGVDRRAERVKALREIAGRTPAEAAAFLAKAAELERGVS
jgi:hypothetical protein